VSGNIISISDEQAKLGQEALKTLRGLGSFVEKALGDTPENLVAYLFGDRLKVRRAESLIRLIEAAKQRLADRGVREPISPSLSIALPLFRGAADEDREELVDLWARLLANAMDPHLNSVRQWFIDAVKRMDPTDAVVLRYIYEGNFAVVRRGLAETTVNQTIGIENISSAIQRRADDVEVSLRGLETLLFFDTVNDIRNWYVTAMSPEFKRACYPEMGK
jgi:hypothetical protein